MLDTARRAHCPPQPSAAMDSLRRITLTLLILAALSDATVTSKDVRTAGLPEKIIGGVIEIVHGHKNKPVTQPPPQGFQQTYPTQGYQPPHKNPQYQWNGQANYQAQAGVGFNYHGQYQNQAQYQNNGQYQNQAQYQNQGQYGTNQNQNGYNQGGTYPVNTGNYNVGQTYPPAPAPVGGFGTGQAQAQGQYQIVYQNQNQPSPPQYPTTGHYQNQQSNHQSNQQYIPNQSSGNFQGQNQNTGGFQGQQQPANNLQGQIGSHPGQGTDAGGHNQSFQVSGGHQASGTAGGPTCVCQAWTKPTDTLHDPAAEKNEKISDEPAMQ